MADKKELTAEQRAKFSKVGKSNVSTSKAHERRVKNLLTSWTGHEFRRRRVEGRGDDVAVVEGVADIIPVNAEVIFAIEAKKEKDFSMDGLLANPRDNHKFTKWWHQTCYDADILTKKSGVKRYPFLIFKPRPSWDWVAVDQAVFDDGILKPAVGVSAQNTVWFPHLAFDAFSYVGKVTKNVSRSKKNPVMVSLELAPCYMFRWKDFEANVDPNSIFIQN